MKLNLLLLLITFCCSAKAQIPTYYNDVNLDLVGAALRNELANKIKNTHTTFLSYTPGVWNALKQTDLNPTNSSEVILIYGHNNNDSNVTTDRTRSKNKNGGSVGDWNREHVYPKSLGTPNFGNSGPGADAHHLRACDVQRNSMRGNLRFGSGSGAASYKTSQSYWYPGDEFKGDVARIVMYLYLRYGNQCLPKNVGTGSATASDNNMLNLFLQWNAQDPVSDLELQRNPILEHLQGNRNPFIDNPGFATIIWGGPQAEDNFKLNKVGEINIKVALQGAFDGNNEMNNNLTNGLIPLTEPYTAMSYSDISNAGSSTNQQILSTNEIVDWVLIELRSTLNNVATRRVGLLRKNGLVIEPDGGAFTIDELRTGSYYLVIIHRNHLAVMTANPIDFTIQH